MSRDNHEGTNKENQESIPLSRNNLLSSHHLFRRRPTGLPAIS
jgi:hypothetical protein